MSYEIALPIVKGRFANGLDVHDVLAVLFDCGTIAATAEKCKLSEDDVRAALSYAMAMLIYIE